MFGKYIDSMVAAGAITLSTPHPVDAQEFGKCLPPASTKEILTQAISALETSDEGIQNIAGEIDGFEEFFTPSEMQAIVTRIMPKLYPHVFIMDSHKLARHATPQQMAEQTERILRINDGGLSRDMIIRSAASYRPYIKDSTLAEILKEKGWMTLEELDRAISENTRRQQEEKQAQIDDNNFGKKARAEFDAMFQ